MMYEFAVWGKDGTLDEPRTISHGAFADFLTQCFSAADLFSMNLAPWTECVCGEMQTALAPFLVKELNMFRWFGYDQTDAPPRDRRQMSVYLYRADMAARDIILAHADDIFLNHFTDGVWQDSVQTLEDLCFFSQGKLIVGTVSHERLLSVAPPDKAFETYIQTLGDWNETKQVPFELSADPCD